MMKMETNKMHNKANKTQEPSKNYTRMNSKSITEQENLITANEIKFIQQSN